MSVFLPFAVKRNSSPFRGNDRTAISAINISGGIQKSRSTGLLPAFVMVSASNITATGTNRPYEDLEYRWDFGDPSGTEVFLNPVTNRNENMNTQLGPEAAYCYRDEGTYTITLTVRGKLSGGGYLEEIVQTTFEAIALANDPTGAWSHKYFDSNALTDGDGLSESSPWNDPQHLLWSATPALRGCTSGFKVALHIKRGSVIACSGEQQMYNYDGRLRIDAYGEGAKPLVTGTGLVNHTKGPYASIFSMNCSDGQPNNPGDCVISDIAFQRLDGFVCVAMYALNTWPKYIHDVYFDNCEFNSCFYANGSPSGSQENYSINTMGVWGGKLIRNPNTDADNVPGNVGNWFFMVGLQWENTEASIGGDTIITHSVYVTISQHSLWKNILFQPTRLQNQLKHSINSSLGNGQWHLISGCLFQGSDGCSPGRSNEVSGFLNLLDFVIEGNLFLTTRTVCLDMEDPQYFTIRDNYCGQASGGSGFIRTRSACFEDTSLRVYRNKIYGAFGSVHLNNFGWELANQITDNEIWNTASSGTAARTIEMVQAHQVAAGTVINYNQYYNPNTTSCFCNNGGASNIDFASWQSAGWDVNGEFLGSPFSWPDPVNGDFGQRN